MNITNDGFSMDWDKTYQAQKHMSVWPWSDLVGFVMRHIKPAGKDFKVLETGCGAGANIPFFASLGVDYYGIEGSETIVKMLKEKFPMYADNIVCGDFTKDIPFNCQFDLIVDRASIKHNHLRDIAKTLQMLHKKLKDDSHFIGIDWSSTRHSGFSLGRPLEGDPFGRTDIESGAYQGVGTIHFFDQDHLIDALKHFTVKVLEHKEYLQAIPANNNVVAHWNFLAKKN